MGIGFDLLAEIRLGLLDWHDFARAGIAFAAVGMKVDPVALNAAHAERVKRSCDMNHFLPIPQHEIGRPADNHHAGRERGLLRHDQPAPPRKWQRSMRRTLSCNVCA